jgi:hypothetical protein
VEHEPLNRFEPSLDELEEYLVKELHPVPEPRGFADRIIALAELQIQEPAPVRAKVLAMKSRPRLWVPTAIAAALLTAGFLTQQTHERHERQQAELAQKQFDSALRITGETLEDTRQQIRDAGVQIGN